MTVAGRYRWDASVLTFQQRPPLHTHHHRCVEQVHGPCHSKLETRRPKLSPG